LGLTSTTGGSIPSQSTRSEQAVTECEPESHRVVTQVLPRELERTIASGYTKRVVMSSRQGRAPERVTCAVPRGCASALVGVAALFAIACGVDDRTLRDDSGLGGTAVATYNMGGAAPMARPEDAAAGGAAGAPDLPVCDYSGTAAADCATMVQNAGFTSHTSGWSPDGGVYGIWRAADANGSKGSGSIDVLNLLTGDDAGVAPGAARQCLPVVPGRIYDLASDVFVEAGQGDGPMLGGPYVGKAVLGAFFFDDDQCEGTSVGFFNAEEVTDSDQWRHVTARGRAPELARAISVRLNALKPIREYMFRATFDNVLVREREP
jgi:hypothetical protein